MKTENVYTIWKTIDARRTDGKMTARNRTSSTDYVSNGAKKQWVKCDDALAWSRIATYRAVDSDKIAIIKHTLSNWPCTGSICCEWIYKNILQIYIFKYSVISNAAVDERR